jgi:hypothetical protein
LSKDSRPPCILSLLQAFYEAFCCCYCFCKPGGGQHGKHLSAHVVQYCVSVSSIISAGSMLLQLQLAGDGITINSLHRLNHLRAIDAQRCHTFMRKAVDVRLVFLPSCFLNTQAQVISLSLSFFFLLNLD